jgi:hypothetical protein
MMFMIEMAPGMALRTVFRSERVYKWEAKEFMSMEFTAWKNTFIH